MSNRNVMVMIDHDKEVGYYSIRIRIPDSHGTYEGLKTNLLSWGERSIALNALEIARTIINMEIDYDDTSTSPDTVPSGGNGDRTYD